MASPTNKIQKATHSITDSEKTHRDEQVKNKPSGTIWLAR
jgi:hypothetical protein